MYSAAMSQVEHPDKETEPVSLAKCWGRWLLMAFGFLNVGLGFIGIFVPGLPTTVFLLIALWAFSRSSDRFQRWLWDHPRFGPSIRAWHHHRVIPLKAKILAVVMMSSSVVIVAVFIAESWVAPVALSAILIPVAAYVVSRAGEIPEDAFLVEDPRPTEEA